MDKKVYGATQGGVEVWREVEDDYGQTLIWGATITDAKGSTHHGYGATITEATIDVFRRMGDAYRKIEDEVKAIVHREPQWTQPGRVYRELPGSFWADLRPDRRIHAIKTLRDASGLSLASSTDIVDAIMGIRSLDADAA